MKYYFSKKTDLEFTSAEAKVSEILEKHGFGVLTNIDIQEKLQSKLGVEFPKYKILGACNPEYAYAALISENKIGTMLPCNVIIHEMPDGSTEVSVIDPVASMMAIENKDLSFIAEKVRNELRQVIETL